jgi:hypothetical protein
MTEDNHRSVIKRINYLTIPTPKKIDRYLIQNLPTYIRENRVATEKDLGDLPGDLGKANTDIKDLEDWRDKTKDRMRKLSLTLDEMEASVGGGK